MKYIVFEGIDGAGKTTVINEVKGLLIAEGYNVKIVKEPSDFVKHRLKSFSHSEIAKAILFTYDRAFSTANFYNDNKDFDIVIGDRSYLSTIAYQGTLSYLAPINEEILLENKALPDAIILLDVSVNKSVARMTKDHISDDYMQSLQNIKNSYLDLINTCIIKQNTVIDANNNLDYVVNKSFDFIKYVISQSISVPTSSNIFQDTSELDTSN